MSRQSPAHRHLLRVVGGPGEFADLIAAGHGDGMRVGWLELAPPERVPQRLETAAAAGALRAVAIGGGRSVAVKPMRGPAVLDDVLREHFRGCALVLVDGDIQAPRLAPAEDGWVIEVDGRRLPLETAALLARLRRPRPWAD